jgi:hypothetical protein
MPGLVYLLSTATSFLCCIMLFRGYRRTKVRLLLWSSLCFLGLTIDNLVLYIDLFVVPDVDLTTIRRLPGLIGLSLLVFGQVWDSK